MKLTLAFSPCPNDTFIFDALIHKKIDTEGLDFEAAYEDVETLNNAAMAGKYDITKLSYHAFAFAAEKYALLDSGSALGFGVGPLLISKRPIGESLLQSGENLVTGIPGRYTTANFLLGIAYPQLRDKKEMIFSAIERSLIDEEIDLGLIIHENRFTYTQKGLLKVEDLGDHWEKLTGCAIPLGGIVVNRNLPTEVQQKVNRLVRRSVEFAFEHPKSGLDYIRSHSQEMEEAVLYKHIELYVNQYSVDLGTEGRKAIDTLFEMAHARNLIPKFEGNLYVS